MPDPPSGDEPDVYGPPAPLGAERWLVALPLVVIVGLVFVCLLGMFVAVMLGGGS
jgi:hypothetical protein